MDIPNSYFSRRPYTVTYYKDGEKKTIRRQPPPVLHNMLPTDKVVLTTGKNDDFQAGDEFTVKHINPRHPNTIQIADGDGNETFVPYFDLNLEKAIAPRDGVAPEEAPERNKYLTWP
jgi:hypothetical protein